MRCPSIARPARHRSRLVGLRRGDWGLGILSGVWVGGLGGLSGVWVGCLGVLSGVWVRGLGVLLTPRARANPTPVAPTISKISKVSSPDPGRGPTLKTLKLGRHTTSSKLKSCTQATGRTRNSENFTIRGGCRHFQSFQSCIPAKGGTLNSDNLKIGGGMPPFSEFSKLHPCQG
jgi:hypothetical protein